MTESAIRTGVIGLGSFGRHHVRHVANNAAANLVGVFDLDTDLTREAADRYGCTAFETADALIAAVDAVVIAAPATVHHRLASACLDAGRHVLVEKPIATTEEDARDLIARAHARNVVLQVGHVERFSPAAEALAERISEPRRISCVRHSPWTGRSGDVDVVLDLMIHDIDHILRTARAPVETVSANGKAVRSAHADVVEAWLTFDNGATATLSASRVADAPERRLTVTEPATAYRIDFAGPSLTVTARHDGAEPEAVPLAKNDNLGDEIGAFLRCVGQGGAPVVTGEDGLAALSVALRIQAAMEDIREVQEFVDS